MNEDSNHPCPVGAANSFKAKDSSTISSADAHVLALRQSSLPTPSTGSTTCTGTTDRKKDSFRRIAPPPPPPPPPNRKIPQVIRRISSRLSTGSFSNLSIISEDEIETDEEDGYFGMPACTDMSTSTGGSGLVDGDNPPKTSLFSGVWIEGMNDGDSVKILDRLYDDYSYSDDEGSSNCFSLADSSINKASITRSANHADDDSSNTMAFLDRAIDEMKQMVHLELHQQQQLSQDQDQDASSQSSDFTRASHRSHNSVPEAILRLLRGTDPLSFGSHEDDNETYNARVHPCEGNDAEELKMDQVDEKLINTMGFLDRAIDEMKHGLHPEQQRQLSHDTSSQTITGTPVSGRSKASGRSRNIIPEAISRLLRSTYDQDDPYTGMYSKSPNANRTNNKEWGTIIIDCAGAASILSIYFYFLVWTQVSSGTDYRIKTKCVGVVIFCFLSAALASNDKNRQLPYTAVAAVSTTQMFFHKMALLCVYIAVWTTLCDALFHGWSQLHDFNFDFVPQNNSCRKLWSGAKVLGSVSLCLLVVMHNLGRGDVTISMEDAHCKIASSRKAVLLLVYIMAWMALCSTLSNVACSDNTPSKGMKNTLISVMDSLANNENQQHLGIRPVARAEEKGILKVDAKATKEVNEARHVRAKEEVKAKKKMFPRMKAVADSTRMATEKANANAEEVEQAKLMAIARLKEEKRLKIEAEASKTINEMRVANAQKIEHTRLQTEAKANSLKAEKAAQQVNNAIKLEETVKVNEAATEVNSRKVEQTGLQAEAKASRLKLEGAAQQVEWVRKFEEASEIAKAKRRDKEISKLVVIAKGTEGREEVGTKVKPGLVAASNRPTPCFAPESHLDFYYNILQGKIPTEIGFLSQLTLLYIDDNLLTGTIPTEIGDLSNLNLLAFISNKLTGNVPSELGNLSQLEFLSFNYAMEHTFSGTIPTELGKLTKLTEMNICYTSFTGSIPTEFGMLTELQYLEVFYNDMTGHAIPTEVGSLSKLDTLNLWYNALTGILPTELGLLTKIEYVDLSHNLFTGTIPIELAELTLLSEAYFRVNFGLNGMMPSGICNLNLPALEVCPDDPTCDCCTDWVNQDAEWNP